MSSWSRRALLTQVHRASACSRWILPCPDSRSPEPTGRWAGIAATPPSWRLLTFGFHHALLTPEPGGGFVSLSRHFAVERLSRDPCVCDCSTLYRPRQLSGHNSVRRLGRPLLISVRVVRHDLVEMIRRTDVARVTRATSQFGTPCRRSRSLKLSSRRTQPSRPATGR